MNKRSLTIGLWFAMGWVLGSALAIAIGVPTIVGAVPVAFAAAAIIRKASPQLWTRRIYTDVPSRGAVPDASLATE
jgi:hypothetical protein